GFKARTVLPTLKQRLLGPTTGKPFVIGAIATAGASAVGLGALAYYGMGLSKEMSLLEESELWPQYVRDRLKSTYGYLAASLGVTAAAAVAASRSAVLMRLSMNVGLMVSTGPACHMYNSSRDWRYWIKTGSIFQHIFWLAHSGVMGSVLCGVCTLGGPSLLIAAWCTTGIVAGLSTIAMTAPSEKFLKWAGPLGMGWGVLIASCIGSCLLPPTSVAAASLDSAIIFGGLILFSAFLLYNMQNVVKEAKEHPE
ncbi:hypothetical protein PMAYCL1PPCAC_01360, partial [Pristionchus mayeri]